MGFSWQACLGESGLAVIQVPIFRDARGFFTERFHEEKFARNGEVLRFKQDNHSRSLPGVLRGLHYQADPDQGKLVGVVRGRIWDVAVDLRAGSPTFGKFHGLELNDSEGKFLWIPGGFAHGFCVLGDEAADVFYKVTEFYNPAKEGGISALDPELNIPWPIDKPLLSERDRALPSWGEYCQRPCWPA